MTAPQSVSIPLYSPLSSRDSNPNIDKDARLVNGFVEKMQGEGGSDDVWVFKRPGFKLLSNVVPAGVGGGVFNWDNNIYSVFSGHLYKDGVDKGAVDSTSSYTFTSCLGAVPKLFLKNKGAAYTYDDTNGLVHVTDGDYPGATVRGCCYLDGTTYVMDGGAHVQGSALNDPTSWDPINVLLAQIEPDFPQCLAKQLVYAVAIKSISTEVFYDAGNGTGSPLGPVQGSKLGVGARSAESVVRCGDDLAWVGTTSEGSVQVMLMSKVHGEVISTPPVERLLAFMDYTAIYAWSARVSGHRFYVVTSKVSNLTLVFDLSSASWYQWQDADGNYIPIVSSTYDSTGQPILQHETNGNLYTLDAATYQDDSRNFYLAIVTPNFDGGLRTNKTCSSIDVIADQVATNVTVAWSDDDYQTFTAPQAVNMDQERALVNDGSSFRKRAFRIIHYDNTPLRIKALNMISSAGTF